MKAVAARVWDDTSLAGHRVVVSGVGKVGYSLARHLVEERAAVVVADVNPDAVARACHDLGVESVATDDAHAVACDIFSPCALGGVLNHTTIPKLDCAAVVGCANNQLATPGDAALLDKAGVLYAPDFIVNAGGVINIAEELVGYHRERAYANVRRIFDTTTMVIEQAAAEGITTALAADRLAERRMAGIGGTKLIRTYESAIEGRGGTSKGGAR
jgi:glutamate dehydrogenase/leucine dehydrogenase